MLADVDVDRDLVGPTRSALAGIGHDDRGRLRLAVAAIAANCVPRVQRFNQAVRKRPRRPLAGLECIGDRVDHVWADEGVALNGKGGPLSHVDPIAFLFGPVLALAGPLRRPALHVDYPDLAVLAALVSRDDLVHRGLRRHTLL